MYMEYYYKDTIDNVETHVEEGYINHLSAINFLSVRLEIH